MIQGENNYKSPKTRRREAANASKCDEKDGILTLMQVWFFTKRCIDFLLQTLTEIMQRTVEQQHETAKILSRLSHDY